MKKFILCIYLSTFLYLTANQNTDNIPDDIKALITYKAALRSTPTPQADDHENNRADSAKQTTVWTAPVIINDKNPIDLLQFTTNVSYAPGKNYSYPYYYQSYPAAIIIDRDNVTIDLAGFTLNLDPSSATSFLVNNPTFGIAITAGTQNVKIISSNTTSKGSISGFTGYAIYMLGSSQIMNSYDIYENYIKQIVIDNVLLTHNTSGIYAMFGIQINIRNTNINYNFSSRPVYGISFSTVLQSSIDNCNVSQNYSWLNMTGIYLQDTINNVATNCNINYNQSLRNGNAIGMQITASSPFTSFMNTVSQTVSNTNLSSFTTGRESIGFLINGGSHTNTISDCQTLYNTHGPSFGNIPPLISPKGYGIKLETTQNNQISNNTSGYHANYGFFDVSLVSTSFFTKNIGIFNPTNNFEVTIPTSSGSELLPVVLIYQDDLSTYNYTTPLLANLSILPGAS